MLLPRLALGLALFLLAAPVFAADLVLLRDGKSDYQIVVPDKSPSEALTQSLQQTARLVQTAFQANGAAVSVLAESQRDPAKPAILLGNTAAAQKNGIDVTRLTGWGYVQKASGRDLIIAGLEQVGPVGKAHLSDWDRVGTAKGVVDFLRQYMGTRFLYPDLAPRQPISAAAKIDLLASPAIEFLPTPSVTVPDDLNVAKTPVLDSFTAYPPGGSFYHLAGNRFPRVDDAFGGHTYERAIPPEKYFATHPEYFALIKKTRLKPEGANAQYCISNPEVQELFFQDLIAKLDAGYRSVDLGQPDGFRPCQCEKCAQLFDTGTDWSEKLWILHRRLAERVLAARPEGKVTLMSYILTAHPPKSFREFPRNTQIMLTGTNEDDIAPWRSYVVPQGFTGYIYNWCPNLSTRYTPMRTPGYIEEQAKRLVANRIQSIYQDGPGVLAGLEGPVYYTMGRMFDDAEHNQAKDLEHEFCDAAFGKAAPAMVQFYDQLYHGIELYARQLGTRDPAWSYTDIYGRKRKHLSDPLQFLGFFYTPELLAGLEKQLTQAEKLAGSEKVKSRLALVRREFDYLRGVARVVHLYHAYEILPDRLLRDRLLDAIDARNAEIASYFDKKGAPKPMANWAYVFFPPIGHNAKHLQLAYDGYQEPYANTPFNWDTKAVRNSPLEGGKQITAQPILGAVTMDSAVWAQTAASELTALPGGGPLTRKTALRTAYDEANVYVLVESELPAELMKPKPGGSLESLAIYLAPGAGGETAYRFTVGPAAESKADAARGFITNAMDPRHGQFDPDWNGAWQYESRLEPEKNRWRALLKIPFKTLGVEAPKAGGFWRANFGRVHDEMPDRVERSLWSVQPGSRGMEDRNDLGELVFADTAPTQAAVSPAKTSPGADRGLWRPVLAQGVPAKPPAAEPPAPPTARTAADTEAMIASMRAQFQSRQWKELIAQYGTEDFAAWPAELARQASEALQVRGQTYSFLKDGAHAKADLTKGVQLAPQDVVIWLTLADNCDRNLGDDEQALAAYRKALALSGHHAGWQPLTATVAIVRILTDQVKTDEALETLKAWGDLLAVAPPWRVKLLRAYGHLYAARGQEQESLSKFREALQLEAQP